MAMQELTVKNVVLAIVALSMFSAVLNPGLPGGMKLDETFSSSSSEQVAGSAGKPAPAAIPRRQTKPRPAPEHSVLPAVIKVLELPNSEALRLSENAFVDLGWRRNADNSGEWVGYIGSETEYVPLNAEQIAGVLKEAQLKSLPPPPTMRKAAPQSPPKSVRPPQDGINFGSVVAMLIGLGIVMYIRYRITQITLNAAQDAAAMAQRAVSGLFAAKRSSPAPSPAAANAPLRKPVTSSTVVRPAPGLFGLFTGARG